MSKAIQVFRARDITSEHELNELLKNCEISSQSLKDVEWLYPWWAKEFGPDLPTARHVEFVGDENFAVSLCVAVEKDYFVIYLFNERDYWFDRLGNAEEFASAAEMKEYVKNLVDQYLADWKEWMKNYLS